MAQPQSLDALMPSPQPQPQPLPASTSGARTSAATSSSAAVIETRRSAAEKRKALAATQASGTEPEDDGNDDGEDEERGKKAQPRGKEEDEEGKGESEDDESDDADVGDGAPAVTSSTRDGGDDDDDEAEANAVRTAVGKEQASATLDNKITIVSSPKFISEVFSGPRRYFVPFFQRLYVWGEYQLLPITEMLRVYVEAGGPNGKRANFQQVTVGEAKDVPRESDTDVSVVDGQQRLTTFAMLIAVTRALLAHLAHKNVVTGKKQLNNAPLKTRSTINLDNRTASSMLRTTTNDARIVPSESSEVSAFFSDYILEAVDDWDALKIKDLFAKPARDFPPTVQPYVRMVKLIYTHLDEAYGNDADKLSLVVRSFQDYFCVQVAEYGNTTLSDLLGIFVAINKTGVPLSNQEIAKTKIQQLLLKIPGQKGLELAARLDAVWASASAMPSGVKADSSQGDRWQTVAERYASLHSTKAKNWFEVLIARFTDAEDAEALRECAEKFIRSMECAEAIAKCEVPESLVSDDEARVRIETSLRALVASTASQRGWQKVALLVLSSEGGGDYQRALAMEVLFSSVLADALCNSAKSSMFASRTVRARWELDDAFADVCDKLLETHEKLWDRVQAKPGTGLLDGLTTANATTPIKERILFALFALEPVAHENLDALPRDFTFFTSPNAVLEQVCPGGARARRGLEHWALVPPQMVEEWKNMTPAQKKAVRDLYGDISKSPERILLGLRKPGGWPGAAQGSKELGKYFEQRQGLRFTRTEWTKKSYERRRGDMAHALRRYIAAVRANAKKYARGGKTEEAAEGILTAEVEYGPGQGGGEETEEEEVAEENEEEEEEEEARGRGRGRGRTRGRPKGAAKKEDEEEEDAAAQADESEAQAQAQVLPKRGRGRGRPKWATQAEDDAADEEDEDVEEEEDVVVVEAPVKRGRGRPKGTTKEAMQRKREAEAAAAAAKADAAAETLADIGRRSKRTKRG